MATPNDIEVMIHYYGSRSVHPRIDAPAVREVTTRFLAAGLIEHTDQQDVYRATEGGTLWIEMLCATPYPEHRWIDPRTAEKEKDERSR